MDLLLQSHVSTWISSALAEAHRRRFILTRRLNPISVPRRLRRQASRFAQSPLAYEQLVRHALLATAEFGDQAYRSLGLRRLLEAPDPLAQLAMREEVSARATHHPLDLAAALRREERRGALRAGPAPCVRARWITEVAALHRLLWDHPHLLVETTARAGMLACAGHLEARANELWPSEAAAISPLEFTEPVPTRALSERNQHGGLAARP